MASLGEKLVALATRVSTEVKAIRTLVNGNATDLSALSTTAKGNMVLAINEVSLNLANEIIARQGVVNDAENNANSLVTTSSNAKIRSLISTAVSQVVDGSPELLNSLKELADAIGNDPNFAASIGTALGNRLRLDTNQTLTAQQQLQGRQNLGVYSKAEIGDPDNDLVAVFNSGL